MRSKNIVFHPPEEWRLPEPTSEKVLNGFTSENLENSHKIIGQKLVLARFDVKLENEGEFLSCHVRFFKTKILSIIVNRSKKIEDMSVDNLQNLSNSKEQSIGFYALKGEETDKCWTGENYSRQVHMIEIWAKTGKRGGIYSPVYYSNLIFALLD